MVLTAETFHTPDFLALQEQARRLSDELSQTLREVQRRWPVEDGGWAVSAAGTLLPVHYRHDDDSTNDD